MKGYGTKIKMNPLQGSLRFSSIKDIWLLKKKSLIHKQI